MLSTFLTKPLLYKTSLINACAISMALMFTSPASANSLQNAIEAFANKDYQQAERLFIQLTKDDDTSNDMIAQFGLAKMYRFGLGTEVDYKQAIEWYKKAAMLSYGVAQSHLGEMYEKGQGLNKDIDMAKSWYQIACSNRCSEGCQNLNRLSQLE